MYFPVAFQILFLVLLAAFGWGLNLRLLSQASVEVRPILQLAQLPAVRSDVDWIDDGLHQNVFRLAAVLSGVAAAGWALSALSSDPRLQTAVALLTYVVVIAMLVMPRRALCYTVRRQFTGLLARIVKPSLSDPVCLADVVMADIMTSCARMFADLFLVACQFGGLLWPRRYGTALAARRGDLDRLIELVREQHEQRACTSSGIAGVLLVSAPYAFRLRQCINEYLRAEPESSAARRHLANAIKYASSFPVIALSATQRQVTVDGIMETKYSDWVLRVAFALWIAAVVFNSLYSFYWDVAFDWDLGHTAAGWKLSDMIAPADEKPAPNLGSRAVVISPADALAQQSPELSRQRDFPRLLRPRRRFASHRVYYAAIALDFLLRIAWTMKLSSYIHIDSMAYGAFWLNLLEIYRRWQWTFLRIEKEAAS
ncbi:protein-ER retention protein [Coemansia sp. RSA 2706]|nr:protein-ER retention protein [Coemansia sp. RSA 2706]KAJ2324719.1 protein-ER retention protein [Coemansia sp. RSA 2702]KAJ2717780.1 protein-ER retention protein [Coemansia sp. Cherry 401B]